MKNVLLAVSGLSPQVVTETLYAIHQRQKRVDAIHKGRDLSDMSTTGIRCLNLENFRSLMSKLGKDLAGGFGQYAAHELAIEPYGKKPDTRYGLKIDKSRIKIIF